MIGENPSILYPGSKDSGQMLETKLINKTKTKPWLKVGK